MAAKRRRTTAGPRGLHATRGRSQASGTATSPTSLETYTYKPLLSPQTDIRLIELLPGGPGDEVRIRIWHVSLEEHVRKQDGKLSLAQVEETLPPDWLVTETPEGKFFFGKRGAVKNQWQHPDLNIDPAQHELPSDRDDFEPEYEALSYVWGSDSPSHAIVIEPSRSASPAGLGILSGAQTVQLPTFLAVTDSLMLALQHLRRESSTRVLWVDAICINQNDDSEKACQVRRMSDIYRLAYRVIVWLGPTSKTSSHGLSTMQYLGAQVELDSGGWKVFPSPGADEMEWYDPSCKLPYDNATWDAVLGLLQRPWFQRVWVVQEIQLASTQPGALIQCGADTIPHALLRRAVICLAHKDMSDFPELRHRVKRAQIIFESMVHDPLWAVLGAVVCRACKDPRDKVYGLLGLASRRFAAEISPDYGEQANAGETYKKAFVAHARVTQRLELFYHCFLDGREIGTVPSWVPDWSVESPWDIAQPNQFAASTSRAHFMYDSNTPDVLEVTGKICATVNRVTHPMPKYLGSRLAVRMIRRWQPRNLGTAIYKPTGEPLRMVYGMTLMCGEFKDRMPEWDFCTLDDWLRQDWPDALFGDSNVAPQETRHASSSTASTDIDLANNRALHFCENRIFIETDEGYIGLAHEDTKLGMCMQACPKFLTNEEGLTVMILGCLADVQATNTSTVGDIIAVFLGCPIPVVLRPTQDGSFQVVGECYMHGLNDAMSFLGPLPAPWKVIGTMGRNRVVFRFHNTESGEVTVEDPRLGPLEEWERFERELDGDDPADCAFFRHKVTGETINYDPRLEHEELELRGVELTKFILV